MIWIFEGGPWDGKTMPAIEWESLQDVLAPQQQIVEPFSGDACIYELVEVTPDTAIYRPKERTD